MEPFYRQYLSRLDRDGVFPCPCGRRHRIGTRQVLAGDGVLEELPLLLRDCYGSSVRLWVLSDENTERAAGARCKELCSSFVLSSTVLPGSPKPRPTLELAVELSREAAGYSPGLVLAVGSGVLSDLGKKVAHELGLQSWCVATAPSVDAYTSGHSVFKSHARHQSIPVIPSQVIFCEIPVLAEAPREMLLAGLGDMLGKFLARLDWSLSSILTGEYICWDTLRLARDSALSALEAARQARQPRDAVPALTDALLTTGFLMQALGSSRPASSAEHTVAHVWELAEVVGDPALELHGLLVGLASRMVLEGYRMFYSRLPDLSVDVPALVQALQDEPSWENNFDPALQAFAGHIREEVAGMERGPEAWKSHLEALLRERSGILSLARESLEDLERGITALEAAGFPFSIKEYGLDPSDAFRPFPYIPLLRNRYSTFNLMHELDCEDEPLAALKRVIEDDLR